MTKSNTSCQLSILSRPDGSVLLSEGETTVLAGVYGPVEVKINKSLIDKATVEAHFRPKSGLPGVKDRVHESIIRNVCEAALAVSFYPRSSIVVVVQELQNSGQLLSCAVNAVCLAALDSGIDMKCLFGAVTCFLDQTDNLQIIAPSANQIKASFVFVFDNVNKNVIASHTEGCFTVEQYKDALSLCQDKSNNVFDFFKQSLQIK